MLGQSFFQLLSPLVFLVFSGGFLLLWYNARDIAALRLFAISYFVGAGAMIGDFLRAWLEPQVAAALTSSLYLATTAVFCAALYTLYSDRVPWKGLMAVAVTVFAAFFWARSRTENFVLMTWIINAGIAAIYAHSLFSLRGRMRRRIDRILQAVIATSTVLLLVRTAVVLWIEGAAMSDATYAGSLAAVTLQLFIAVVALAVAGVLFAMFGLDIVGRLTETSETDPLTGILNRRGFEARIVSIADDGPAPGSAHAVVMADIDLFKNVNDSYGHEAGDAVIKAFARLLCEAARESDHVVRWGGEEFLVVIIHSETTSARLFAEAVRARWESLPHDCLGGKAVTASFGIAGWREGQDLSGASREADTALYRAKSQGRNRVCVHEPEISGGRSQTAVA